MSVGVHACLRVRVCGCRSPQARRAAAARPGEFPSSICSEASTLQVLLGHAATAPIRRTSPPGERRRQARMRCTGVDRRALRAHAANRSTGPRSRPCSAPPALPGAALRPLQAKPRPQQNPDPNKTPSTIAAPLAEGRPCGVWGDPQPAAFVAPSSAPHPRRTAGGLRRGGGGGAVLGPGGRRVRERRLHTKERRSEPHRAGNQSPRRPRDKRGCGAAGGARTERA